MGIANGSIDRPDVLIVGASTAGSALAVGLKDAGFDVLLVERESEVRERFRGEYLQPFAVKALEKLGFGSVFEDPSLTRVKEFRFRDLGKNEREVISEVVIKYAAGSTGLVVPCRRLTESLRAVAKRALGERFVGGATVEPTWALDSDFFHNPRFTLRGADGLAREVRPRWVVGCDGRNSTVRGWMNGGKAPVNGSPTLGAKPEFIVGCEIAGRRRDPSRYEVMRTANRGTLAFFQLGPDSQRVYWNSRSGPDTNKSRWEKSLAQMLPGLREVTEFETSEFSGLAGCPADSFWGGIANRGKFLLAGDALGVTTPLGGQGMTCAMYHATSILNLLSGVRSTESKHIIAALGADYDDQVRRWYKHVSLLNFGLYYLFYGHSPLLRLPTRHILATWSEKPEMQERVGRLFAGDDMDTPRVIELLKLWGLSQPIEKLAHSATRRLSHYF